MNEPLPRRRSIRFSLLTLLLATTLIALAVTVVLLYRELGPLRREVARLRNELGQLDLDDLSQVHAIQLEGENELEWKWRVWIPHGARYQLRVSGGPIPFEGFPSDGGTIRLHDADEMVIRYRIRRDAKDGSWQGTLNTPSASIGSDPHPWVDWPSRSTVSRGVGRSTERFDPHHRIELMRYRVAPARLPTNNQEPSMGFLIWLEPY